MHHGRGDCFPTLQASVLCADTEHLITLLAVLWGMEINANKHQGVTWPYSNCGNKFHAIWPAGQASSVTAVHPDIGAHTVEPAKNLRSKFTS